MNKYLQIIRNLNKEIQIKWWLLKKYKSLIEKIILLKQSTPVILNNTLDLPLLKLIIYGKTEQDGEPTPETPIEIKNVEGKNLFDKNSSGIITGYWVNENNNQQSGSYIITDYMKVQPLKTYKSSGTNNVGTNPAYCFYDINKTFISGVKHNGNSNYTITTPANCYYVRDSINNDSIDTYMLEEGSLATDYLPYNSIGVKVQNKNILNPDNFAENVITTPYSSSHISTYNETTKELNIKMGDGTSVFDNFKENTRYTIILKYNFTNSNVSNLRVRYTDNTTDNIAGTVGVGTLLFVTASGKNVKSIEHSAGDSAGTRTLYLQDSGIFEGVLTQSDFVAHQEQTALFTFEEGQYLAEGGYLADDGIHNVYAQKSLNGTEDWRSAGTAGQYYAYYLQVSDMKSSGSSISNNFKCDSIHFVTDSSHAEEGGGYIVQRNFVIFSSETSVNDFKTWLSNHNMILQYELADPQPTPYTPEQQAQWEEIKKMRTYEEQTTIDVITNFESVDIDVGFYQKKTKANLENEMLTELSNGKGVEE